MNVSAAVAPTHSTVVTPSRSFRAPARSAAAPSTGDKRAQRIALIDTARDHHAVPVASSGAIALVKYVE